MLHSSPSCRFAHAQGQRQPAFTNCRTHLTRCSQDASNVRVGSTSSDQGSAAASSSSPVSQPWQIVEYHTKKLRRKTGTSSDRDAADIVAIAEPAHFTQEAKMALAIKAVAAEAQLPEAHVAEQLALLQAVLPNLCDARHTHMKPVNVVRLAIGVDQVASKLIMLRTALPNANISKMVASSPQLLQPSLEELEANIMQVKQLLATAEGPPADALLEQMPMLLDPAVLSAVLSELQRLFCSGSTGGDPVALLQRNPSLALSCQSLSHQARGDRDAEYLRSIFSAEGS